MPDLDQLLDALVADVTAGTRAPGARTAIKQARRRRARLAVAAAGAVAVIAAGGGLAAGTLGGSDQLSPIGEPTTPSSESPTMQESAESQTSLEDLGKELDALLALVPGWAITRPATYPEDYDYAFNGPCSRDWDERAISGGDGGIFGTSLNVGHGKAGFPSEARASNAAAEFVENLASCKKTAWRIQPIPQTGAVLASSDHAVAWIQEGYREVHVLQATTTDGPPPASVQVAVAEWLVAYIAEENTD